MKDEETMYKSEKLDNIEDKFEELEEKPETKDIEVQFESRVEEVILRTQKKNHQEAKMECKAEVKKELDKVLSTAVEQGLRDLPFEMVCAYQDAWTAANSVVNYDRISVEFNNSDRPGGGDGTMNIETGVFTTVTSGYYIVTFSAHVKVQPGEYTEMYL